MENRILAKIKKNKTTCRVVIAGQDLYGVYVYKSHAYVVHMGEDKPFTDLNEDLQLEIVEKLESNDYYTSHTFQ